MFTSAPTWVRKPAMVAAVSSHGDSFIGEKPHMNKRARFLLVVSAVAAAMGLCGCSKLPEPTAAMPSASAPGGNVSDVDVTEHVKTALQQNEALKGFNITVSTIKGDVKLQGMVDTQAQIDEAVKVARASTGAHAIHNELTTPPTK